MKKIIEKTLYFINSIDGVDGPPYAHTVANLEGTSLKVEENHVDDAGNKIHARTISKEEFDAYWEEQDALQKDALKKAAASQKKARRKKY